MDENTKSNLNLYDYVGFPNPQQRAEAKKVFNMEKLLLKRVTNADLLMFNVLAEQYHAWSNHINNFRSHLDMHLLLMYYQYKQNPLDIIDIENFQSERGAHKVLFDTFAEDASLYLISYFDKHLEMFNDLFHLSKGEKYSLSRKRIIKKMEQVDKLRVLSIEYNTIKDSKAFQEVNEIRNNFVHNKSSSQWDEYRKRKKKRRCICVFHNAKDFNQNLSCNMLGINHEIPAVVCSLLIISFNITY